MIDLFEIARHLQTFCDEKGWQSCFIGGIAVQRWGQPPPKWGATAEKATNAPASLT